MKILLAKEQNKEIFLCLLTLKVKTEADPKNRGLSWATCCVTALVPTYFSSTLTLPRCSAGLLSV